MVRARPKFARGGLPAHEADVQELLYRFEDAVAAGEPASFPTLRAQWLAMRFSFVFETRLLEIPHEDYVQLLFSSALDCLEAPLRSRGRPAAETPGQPPASLASQPDAQAQPGANAGPSGRSEPAAPSGGPSAEPSSGAGRSSPQLAASLSLADLVASDDEAEEDAEQQQAIARALMQPGPGPKQQPCGAPAAVPQGREGEAEGEADLSALELLSGLPELMRSLDADEPEPPEAEASEEGAAEAGEAAAAANGAAPERQPDPATVRLGAVFLLWALYRAQPACQLVRIYVPLHLLRGLAWTARQSPQAAAVLRRLAAEDAFVVGAVRRPISGTKEAQLAARSTRSALATDHMEQRRQRRQALAQLKASSASWGALQHVQLLCNSYRAAQERLWQGQAHTIPARHFSSPIPIVGLFDLQTGEQLGRLVAGMHGKLTGLLPYHNRSMFLASEAQMRAAEERANQVEAAATAAARAEAAAAAKQRRQAAAAERQAEQAAALEAAAARRQQRWAAEQEADDDMPTFAELGITAPGESEVEGAAADPDDLLLPRAARAVELRRRAEATEVRQRLAGWKRAFESSLAARDGQREPAREPASEPASEPPAAPLGGCEGGGAISASAAATSAGSWSPPRGAAAAEAGGDIDGGGRRAKRRQVGEASELSAAPPPQPSVTKEAAPPSAEAPSAEDALQGLNDMQAKVDRLLDELL